MDNTLQHWGIKGMKWGVRRYQNKDGSLTPAGKKRYNDSSGSETDLSSLSDEEIRRKINRLQLEKQYRDLMKPAEQKKINAGKKFVQDVLLTSGKNVGNQLVTYVIGSAINTYLGKGKKIINVNVKDDKKDK